MARSVIFVLHLLYYSSHVTRIPDSLVYFRISSLIIYSMFEIHARPAYMSPWNTPAGRSNQLCRSPNNGCTAQAGKCDKLTSGGEGNGVALVVAAPATAE